MAGDMLDHRAQRHAGLDGQQAGAGIETVDAGALAHLDQAAAIIVAAVAIGAPWPKGRKASAAWQPARFS